jgi:iron complex outermembrane receptor protein
MANCFCKWSLQNKAGTKASAIHAEVSKDYFVINGKADVSISKHFGVFIQLDNIGDTKYSDLLGTPMPGRWLMGGIRASF